MDIQNSSGPERERDSKVRKDFRDWRDRKPTPTSPERERRKTKGEGVRFPESGVQRTEDGGLRDELDIIQRNGHTKFVGARKRKGP